VPFASSAGKLDQGYPAFNRPASPGANHDKSQCFRALREQSRERRRPSASFCWRVRHHHRLGPSWPLFGYGDTWQLAINTATTIVTFLMVFLIQNTQNRDAKATQIKLDEIIRALEGAHNVLLDLEELSEQDLVRVRARYIEIARKAREALAKGLRDTDEPEVILGDAIADELAIKGAPGRQ
jgi:low affinity Fe/Cu permease